jgi:uncharacterized protein (DUF58 family)
VVRRIAYRQFRRFTALQHHARRRLTPAGQLVAGALVGAVIVGPNTRLTVAYQAFAFLAALLLLAWLVARRPVPRLGVRRTLPRVATVGEPLTYRLAVVNPGRAAEPGVVVLEDLADPRPSFEEFDSTPEPDEERRNRFDRAVGYPRWAWLVERRRLAVVPPLALDPVPARATLETRVTVTPRGRGRLTFTGATLARLDPLGLVRALRPVDAPGSLLVLPRRYPVPALTLASGRRYQHGGVALSTSVGDSEEFQSLRDYRPGDPLRRLHWRSWARTGKPIVKEYQDEFFVRHGLILDTFVTGAPGAAFEEAVSIAASFACSVQTQESLLDLMFVGPRAYTFTAGRGVGNVERMLEILACVGPCHDHPFTALHRLVVERHAALSGAICVLLAWDAPRRALVHFLRAAGVPTVVLHVVEAGTPAEVPTDGVHRLQVGRIAEGLRGL